MFDAIRCWSGLADMATRNQNNEAFMFVQPVRLPFSLRIRDVKQKRIGNEFEEKLNVKIE